MALLSPSRPAAGRYWKIDVDGIDLDAVARGSIELSFDAPALHGRGRLVSALDEAEVEDLEGTVVDARSNRFAALNVARRDGGVAVVIPKGVSIEEPIVVRQRLGEGLTLPYVLVVAEEGSRATVISRLEGASGALVSEIVEIVVKDGAELTFVGVQSLASDARVFSTKRGSAGTNGILRWALAELGAELSLVDVRSIVERRGVETSIAGVFFPAGDQHVDFQSEVEHRVGDSRSDTLFKTAATARGQARFLGNIRILPGAHGTEATLRDDALLLSKAAHVDSIPALEIGANDVKAFHGATVGAIDEDEVFYAMTRGIGREEAERMIALGFFEPALARFPGEALRDELRRSLAEKIA